MWRECVILVLMCVFGAGGLSGRGFFCRDPDTGKLHSANSTWTATTFCGKYHCKLKRKNITSSHYAPLRQINITNLQLLGENLTTVDIQTKEDIVKKEDPVNAINTDKRTELDSMDINNSSKESQGITLDDIKEDKNVSDKDRYLSEQEIKSLTALLHTLKKGDLDAIVEIYNLAQDIYKELDKTSTDHLLQEVMTTAETINQQMVKSDIYKKLTKHNHASYWYEPLSSGRTRLTDILRPDVIRTDINPEVPALAVAVEPPAPVNVVPVPVKVIQVPAKVVQVSAKLIPVTKPTPSSPITRMTVRPPIPGFKVRKTSDTFFNGPLTYKDFGKLPYYYPMSNFQRTASYKHEQNKKLTVNAGTLAPAPLRPLPKLPPAPVPNIAQKALTNKSIQIGGKYQKELAPSIFLPYSFANMQNNNWSLPQNLYHRTKLETHRKEESLFNNIELLRREENVYEMGKKQNIFDDQLGKRRKQENVLEKIELLIKNEDLYHQLGPRRKGKNVLDKVLRNEENFANQLGAPRKEDNLANVLEASRKQEAIPNQIVPHRKQENFPSQVGPHRTQENFPSQIGPHRTQENFPSQIGPRKTQENFPNQMGPRRTQESILDKLELLTKDGNLFDDLEPSKKQERNDINNKNTITVKKQVNKKSNVILMNPDLENFQDLQIRPSMKEENVVNANFKQEEEEKGRKLPERRRPEWQTDSLPESILDDVRAHIQEKQRLFFHPVPLKKKVKLERVAKVLHLDNTRSKRSAEEQKPINEPVEPELYEVYIESTTCNADYSIPGYFRYGNLSQPFPECCPQRIPAR